MNDAPHPPLGMDLGTTHSLVAVFDGGAPRVLDHALGTPLVPSQLALDDKDHLLVGAPARTVRLRRPERGLARFKPDMGRPLEMRLGDTVLDPVSASALILKELKATAEAALDQPVERAVISVPAWFGEPQRKATLDAGRLAGLEVQRLINEPTAAALAHGLHHDGDLKRVAVLDLGGGTFDVTVLELFDGIVDVRASSGDVHLGGEDVTDAIENWVLRDIGALAVKPPARARLRHEAERAKRALAGAEHIVIDRTGLDGGTSELDRATLAALCTPLMDRMRRLVGDALGQAQLTPDAIDEIVLAGGAVRMHWVQDLVVELFGKPALPLGQVDYLIALGAAVQAALVDGHEALRERLVTDVLTHSLGVSAVQSWEGRHYGDRFVPLLARGTTLPASRTSSFHTLHHEQSQVTLQVYEGERRIASENHPLGTLEVDVPTHEGDTDGREELEVRFTHDVSGLLQVEATVLSTGDHRTVLLERGGQRYDDEARAQATAELAKLKIHPRDLLPNRWLLERAVSIVEQLTGEPRQHLDQHVLAFEAALDRGDPVQIENLRTPLAARVEALERQLRLDLPT